MLTSFNIAPDGSGSAVIRTENAGENRDEYYQISATVMQAFLDTPGDASLTYRESLTALVLSQGV